MKRIFFAIIWMTSCLGLFAQQEPMYGQYIFNNAIINPAQAGLDDLNQVGFLHRRQWLGMEGAPTTTSFFVNSRLPKNLGFAGGVFQDKVGPIQNLTFQGDVSSHVQLNDNWSLSGGLRLMATSINANFTTLQTNQGGDPNFSNNVNTGLNFNAGLGALLYNDQYFFGASLPRIFNQNIRDGGKIVSEQQRHLFFYGGGVFPVYEDVLFKPSMLIKTTSDAPAQFDLNLVFNYRNYLDIGPMLRSKTALGFLAGFKVTPGLYIGYMYEYPLNDINVVANQTHELSLRILWKSKYEKRVHSPRYFL